MNISQYKKSMNEISVKKFSTEELVGKYNNNRKRANIKKFTLTFLLIGILFYNFVWLNLSQDESPRITITAYAAENEIQLTNSFVDFSQTILPKDGSIDNNGKDGYVNSNIHFRCDGENIKSITYTCSDQTVDRSNWDKAPAYYVENMIIPIKEYNKHMKDNDCLYGYYAPGEGTANITKLIGNSYSVNYEDQNSKQYGLVIAATVNQAGDLKINDTIINVDVHFNDGSIQHKKLYLRSDKDSLSEIQIKLL